MSIDVVVVPTRKKRIDVVRVPAYWQNYLELVPELPINTKRSKDNS